MVPDVRPGFGNDPTNGFENFVLDGTLIDLIQTVGAPTNHHEMVQLPNGNFLLMIGFEIRPPTAPFSSSAKPELRS